MTEMCSSSQPSTRLHSMLRAAVQSVQWTYSLFWQFCPQQGILVWGDGYYNGAIKTRKTVQPMEVTDDETSLQRSQQLRELYDSLSADESTQQNRRLCAALSPEDLTESEWFYLMCVSFSFPPGVGLPGKAYAKRQHVWLTGANEVNSKVFSRAILAKSASVQTVVCIPLLDGVVELGSTDRSASVQTVVCIPLLDGVVELGSTDRIQEYNGFIQQVKSFFVDHHQSSPPKPPLSEHSTSIHIPSPMLPATYATLDPPLQNTCQIEEEEEEDDEEDEDEEQEHESEPEADIVHLGGGCITDHLNLVEAQAEPSELMQLEMSADIRLGSPEDGSNNLDSDFQLLGMTTQGGGNTLHHGQRRDESNGAESSRRWSCIEDPLCNSLQPPPPGGPILDKLTQDYTHYSETVSSILNLLSTRWSGSSSLETSGYLVYSSKSSFYKWAPLHPSDCHVITPSDCSSGQWLLKYVLFTVPFLHTKHHVTGSHTADVAASRPFRKGDELSANHVLAERRRREKLNKRFVILRSLVPFVTKMDKASILGDTIEYVKQLHKKIQDLETTTQRTKSSPVRTNNSGQKETRSGVTNFATDKRKIRIVEGSGGGGKPRAIGSPPPAPVPPLASPLVSAEGVTVQVSIIENDALVEMQCPHREGLLLDVMVMLRELKIEVTAVQSSLTNGIFVAEMRAKVKENTYGKKPSIVEVQRAINQIIPQYL